MRDPRSADDAERTGEKSGGKCAGEPGGDERAGGSERGAPGTHIDEHLCLDLLNGLLGPADEQAVLDHIAECPDCEKLVQARAGAGERLATRGPPLCQH